MDQRTLTELMHREPRSTVALEAILSARKARHVRVVHAGSSFCVMTRQEPFVWIGYPQLIDPDDAPTLAAAIERTPVVGLDGQPPDMEPLVEHLERIGETVHFETMILPSEECYWDPSGPDTRMALPPDLDALDSLFADYEIHFARGRRARRRYLQERLSKHAVVVHIGSSGAGASGIDGAALIGALTPQFLTVAHLRVHPDSRGQGISWAIISRVVEIAQAYGVGVMGSLSHTNPMTMPQQQGRLESHPSVNLRLPDRLPGERTVRRLALRVSRKLAG